MLSSQPSVPGRILGSLIISGVALLLYRATLLPGLDFGDSGSLQTVVGSPLPTPRDGYPLYFAIGGAWLKLAGGDPAHALNVVSAIEGAVACGLLVLVAAELAGSVLAAMGAGLLFAVSYTFWSQSIVAEVYALHIALTLGSLLALFHWEHRQTAGRLALFFACYALAFGNHLSTILLLPGFTLYLLLSAEGGWRSLVRWRVVVLAAAIALAGAAQYLWNIRTLWFFPDPPATLFDALRTFWFDVTKSDWRDTMVLQVPQSMLRDRAWMYWFDLRQQFGIAGVTAATVGAAWIAAAHPRRAALLFLLYAVNLAFAFGYNVGDTHVFYLPSHLVVAPLAAVGAVAVGRMLARYNRHGYAIAATLLVAYAGWRGYRDFPALDRSRDRRPATVLDAMTGGLDDARSVLLADLNWQVANGLSYYTNAVRREVAVGRMRDVLLYAPALVDDNLAIGRQVVVTAQARRLFEESFGPLMSIERDPRLPPAPRLAQTISQLAPGTRYVLCVLKPTRDFALDGDDLTAALRRLDAGSPAVPAGDYAAIAGVVGSPPALVAGSNHPFESTVQLGGVSANIRMESWLAMDTIRRMGFGHVVVNRRHTLIVERGISFVAFEADGSPTHVLYSAGLFEAPQRYLISR